MWRLWCPLLAQLLHACAATGTCFSDGIPPSLRKNLTNQNGESYPVGMWINDWAAGYVAAGIAHILIEERLGYHVIDTGPGPGSLNGFYALLGCTRPMNFDDRGCGPEVTYNHVNMEVWGEAYATQWAEIQAKYPSIAPVDVGSIGYTGKTSLFFAESINKAGLAGSGTPLDYFRGWDAHWNEPWKYFNSVEDVDKDLVYPCNETRFTITAANQEYLAITGDTDGVQEVDGSLQAVCPDGHFWLPPSCRANASQCVPYFTGGLGWNLDEVMQKVTSFNMPMGIAVAKSWSTVPPRYNSTFFWWVPDPTFLSLAPVELIFPKYDFVAWGRGDRRTSINDSPITKLVSQDLATLAPNIVDFVTNVRLSMDDMNMMLLDMLESGDSYLDVACRWLNSNASNGGGSSWLPDKSKCFPGFGLYNLNLQTYVDDRSDITFVECRACESGTYSARLEDTRGATYACRPCERGTNQPSGAALSCDPCRPGEYQNSTGSRSCARCEVGDYQDQPGSPLCTKCPASTTTLGLGSVSVRDCGCESTFMDVSSPEEEMARCEKCSEGLECPSLSTVGNLVSGTAELGEQFVPAVMKSYFSPSEDPLSLFRCIETERCPGGTPGVCEGGLTISSSCTACPDGTTWRNNACRQCETWQVVLWYMLICFVPIFLIISYYMMTSSGTAKASVLFTTSLGMCLAVLQSVGIIGMVTVEFPSELAGIFFFLRFLVFDLDKFGVSCVAGSDVARTYAFTVLFFPLSVGWMGVCYFVSQLLPRRHRWELSKTVSCAGQVLQVSFSTMSAVAIIPLMCFSHPNGVKGVLKYPGITCGSGQHTTMTIFGVVLLVAGVFLFLAVCMYAVFMVPKWSAQAQNDRVRAFRFLVFRFRLDSWWYGVPLLLRGPLLSLPIALATDYPPVQLMFVVLVLLLYLSIESRAWPWKIPLLNVLDFSMSLFIVMLVVTSTLQLPALEVDGVMQTFANAFSVCCMAGLGASMCMLVLMTGFAFWYTGVMGGQKDLLILNLQRAPSPVSLAKDLSNLAIELSEMSDMDLITSLSTMPVFDVNALTNCMTLLTMEVTKSASVATTLRMRISSTSFQPTMPEVQRKSESIGSQDSRTKEPLEDIPARPRRTLPGGNLMQEYV